MKFKRYIEGNFIKREKRFFVYYECEDKSINIAYCANTGKMTDILKLGNKCIFTPYEGKMQYKWEMTFCRIFKSFVGTNTQNPNKILMEAIEEKRIPYFAKENNFKQEVSFKKYRADIANENTIIEVKHVHWRIENNAFFPDCITERGARQMDDLSKLAEDGKKCFVVYIIQRSDIEKFSVAKEIDPVYYRATEDAKKRGVKFLAFKCHMSSTEIKLTEEVEII